MKKYRGVYSIIIWLTLISLFTKYYFILFGTIIVLLFVLSEKLLLIVNLFVDRLNNTIRNVIVFLMLSIIYYLIFSPLKYWRFFLMNKKKQDKFIKFTINSNFFLKPW